MAYKRLYLVILLVFIVIIVSLLPFVMDPEIVIRSQILLLPLVAALTLSILSVNRKFLPQTRIGAKPTTSRIVFLFLVASFASTQLVSAAVRLLSIERNLLYFAIEGLGVFIVSLQICYGCSVSKSRSQIVLAEIGILIALEVLLKTFTFPYYVSTGDISYHEEYMRVIISTGHIGGFMGVYQNMPALHILSATTAILNPLLSGPRAILIVFVLCGFSMPFLFHSILSKLTRNVFFTMVFSFVGPMGFSILDFLSQGLPYVLAVFFFLFLLLATVSTLTSSRAIPRYVVLALVFTLLLVISHQVSIPFIIGLCLLSLVLYRRFFNLHSRRSGSGYRLVLILVVVYVAYSSFDMILFYGGVFRGFILTNEVLPVANLPSDSSLFYYFLRRIPLAALLFLAFLGFLSFAGYSFPFYSNPRSKPVLTTGVVAFFFYIPGLSALSQFVYQYVAAGPRNSVFAEQFVLSFVALSISRTRITNRTGGTFVLVLALSLIVFGAIVSETNTTDTNELGSSSPTPKVYFDNEEVGSLIFLQSHSAGIDVWSDFVTSRFLIAHNVLSEFPSVEANNSVLFPSNSFVYLRIAELQRNGLCFYQPAYGYSFFLKFQMLYPTETGGFENENNVVFDSGGTVLLQCTEFARLGGS